MNEFKATYYALNKTYKALGDIHEAHEILEEMQRDRDPDERKDLWGRPKPVGPDNEPE